MPQIILKKRTTDLASYTSFTRDVDQYKKRHFDSSNNNQVHLFLRTPITRYFRRVNIVKFFRVAFLKKPPGAVL